MKLQRIPYSGSTDSRLVFGPNDLGGPEGEDIARISGPQDKDRSCIAFHDKVAKEIVRAVNGRDSLLRQLDEAHGELDRYAARQKATLDKLKPINLNAISRHSDLLLTHIAFEDSQLREILTSITKEPGGVTVSDGVWLKFGEATIHNEGRVCFIGSRMRSGITDQEHDSAYCVRIGLIGLRYEFTNHHVSYFKAHLTTDPDDIRVYSSDYVPEQDKTAEPCEHCQEKHLTIEKFVPPMYELAHLVAGKAVSISMGPNWRAIEGHE